MSNINTTDLMSIGRFAASCRLSVKALRHYADYGLLVPAYIDSRSGYRYYSREQARTAVVIGMLRSLDISLPVIQQLLNSNDESIENLLAQQERLIAKELAIKQQALASIRHLKQKKSLLPYKISTRVEPEYRVIRRTIKTSVQQMVPDSSDAVYQLMDDFKAVSDELLTLVMCINEQPQQSGAVDVHICIGANGSERHPSDSELVTIEGGTVAWCLHQGAYEELGLAYHNVFAWMQDQGHSQAGAMREIYINDPADTPVERLQTEVIVPINL